MNKEEPKKKIGPEIPMRLYQRLKMAKAFLALKNEKVTEQEILIGALERELDRLGIPDPEEISKVK